MKKSEKSAVTELFKWLLNLAIVHLLADIVYAMIFGGMIMDLVDNDQFAQAYKIVFIYGVIVLLLFPIYYTVMLCRDVDMRNDVKAYMKEKNFTVIGYFKDNCLKMTIARLIVFVLWHVPAIIMYLGFTMAPILFTFFGRLWVVEAGSIAFTGSVILGILINVLAMFVSYVICLLIGIHNLHKDIQENSFT